jgi:SNF2 family DNA or RNA helicase
MCGERNAVEEFTVPLSPNAGDFVELRGRQWLVDAVDDAQPDLTTVQLSCIADDAQGEQIEVLWDAELDARILENDSWAHIGQKGPDSPEVLAAYLRAIRWRSATAADRDLLQAPFRAGIRLDAYQLLPLRKALRLPRVNLLIADDVGLGKTVEAGLIARELLLRRRIDFIVIAAPPAMTIQWKDELESKFGLTFEIIDRERIGALRRSRGFSVNPWTTGSRFIISHSLLPEEDYMAGLRDVLGEFRSRALFILDEAHHAAPSAGARYAISSQMTRAVREISDCFEHRLFLTATPHNGHSNSFSALLEMLDPQRFTRGVEIRPKDLEPVMVRRLKSDLRRLGEAFPERRVEAIKIAGLPEDAPELDLWRRLAAYGELRKRRIVMLPAQKAALAKLAFVGLQQRLLSSIPAFLRTLKTHRKSLEQVVNGESIQTVVAAAQAFVDGSTTDKVAELGLEDNLAESVIEHDDEATAEAATIVGSSDASAKDLRAELALVDGMLAIADSSALSPDARVGWLVEWLKANFLTGLAWNNRRLIIFTEWEDTRRWLERRLHEALAHTDRADERFAVFTGATGQDRREQVKYAFNADPTNEPLRILICTDAAREGINLQTYCSDLIHFDLPWNPSRLEQRNGRIDRKLQPAKQVFCRYFRYDQREADIVLEAVVRKTEIIRNQLGSAGQVIEKKITSRLAEGGIDRAEAAELAKAIEAETEADRLARATAEMDDEEQTRYQRLLKEQDDLRDALERSRERVGVDVHDLQRVVGAALARAGVSLDSARAEKAGNIVTFKLDPNDPAFAQESGWQDTFDDLRVRPRKRGERINEWRKQVPIRAIAFEPPRLPDGRDAPEVVQVHLEHRLVRRLLSRFLSQGFQSGLSRISVIEGPGAQPRVILMGRLALFGAGATRLHEEIIPVAAIWTEDERDRKPIKALGESGEERTLNQLEQALRDGRAVLPKIFMRIRALVERDIGDLLPTLERIVTERREMLKVQLAKRGEAEARLLRELLERQRSRIAKAASDFDLNQLLLPGIAEAERLERDADRRHWQIRLSRLESEINNEPQRIRASYDVHAHRLEPVGLVYLWPASG